MRDTTNARFLQLRGSISVAILGLAMLRGLVVPAAAGSAPSPSLTEVAQLAWVDPYLARQPVHRRFIARPLDGFLLADSFREVSPPRFGGPPPLLPEPRLSRPAGIPAPRWVVSAIMITETRRVAIVNDSLVGVGAAVGKGATVTAIEPDRVILLESGGVRRELRVQAGSQ